MHFIVAHGSTGGGRSSLYFLRDYINIAGENELLWTLHLQTAKRFASERLASDFLKKNKKHIGASFLLEKPYVKYLVVR